MYIAVSEIPPGGSTYTSTADGEGELDFGGRDLFPLKDIRVDRLEFRVVASGDEVSLEGSLEARIRFECDRCGEDVEDEWRGELKRALTRVDEMQVTKDSELRLGDMDLSFYSGEGFLVEDLVYDQIVFAIPQKKLCKGGCRGLCQLCGVDMNIDPCSCGEEIIDPRFEILKKLVEDKER